MSAEKISITINGVETLVESGSSLLDACLSAGIKIPTLCHLKDVSSNASCGVCVVEVEGAKSLVRSCVGKAAPGMKVKTASPRVLRARKNAVELLLANHPADCLTCARNGSCELQDLSRDMGIRDIRFARTRAAPEPDESSYGLVRDNDKCVLCGRCVAVCAQTQGVSAINFAGRGIRTRVSAFMDRGLAASSCVQCGQCSVVCPTGAIVEHDHTSEVWRAIADPECTVVVQTAPAIRASLGEALGMEMGSLVTGKMVAALRRLGFAKVFDTQFTADLTIMEEG
jgi:NADH dehydrogenase/NADH:ubiquinone oxidoreductase subunit G